MLFCGPRKLVKILVFKASIPNLKRIQEVDVRLLKNDKNKELKESDQHDVKNLDTSTDQTSVKLCERAIQLKSNIPYILYSFGQALANSTTFNTGCIVFIVDECLESGLSKNDGDHGLLLFNVAGTFGRLLPGLLQQLPCIKPLMVPVFASAVNAVTFLCFGIANMLGLKLGAICALGAPFGMFITCLSVTVLNIVGLNLLEDAMGVTLFVIGCLSISSGPLGS